MDRRVLQPSTDKHYTLQYMQLMLNNDGHQLVIQDLPTVSYEAQFK